MVSPLITKLIVNKSMNWSSNRSLYFLISYSNKPMLTITIRTLHFILSTLKIHQFNIKLIIQKLNPLLTFLLILLLDTF